MKFFHLLKPDGISIPLALGLAAFLASPLQAQESARNDRPTLDPIADYTTAFSKDVRYIELNGITPGQETDQQVFIEVSTEDKDLIESIGAEFVDNGKAFISYQLKDGAVGTATVKVVVSDDGPNPASVARTFRITVEGLNREIELKPLAESDTRHSLKATPNPVVESTRISFSTPTNDERVAVDLYSLSGAKIKQLFIGNTLANRPYYVDFNSKSLATGVYIVRLTTQSHTSNLRLVVAK